MRDSSTDGSGVRCDEPALVAYVAGHSSAVALTVYDADDTEAAGAALRAAAAEICRIPHPDEPDDGLPNWCAVLDEDGVPVLRLDMKDEVRYAALVVRIVRDALADAGVGGRLAPVRPPEEALPYDANADLYTGMDALTELDARGLPPGFPAGFPVPEQATLVMAQRYREGAAEHAAWRRSTGPFTGYLARLREYGCLLGDVPRVLTLGAGGGIVRYTLWREGRGGRVTLLRAGAPGLADAGLYWYVSVVWGPEAERPAGTVEPAEEPDDRPAPRGPAAARDLAEFLVPAPLVPGYETVVAFATLTQALDRLVTAPPDAADRRARPAVIASRLAPVLGRLDPDRLTLVRHVCLTMVANLFASGRRARPDGLTLLPDADGYLYAADIRERAAAAVGPDLVPVLETGIALVQGTPMIREPLSGIRSAPVRPPADRYAWLFAGLDPAQLAVARDACWRLLGA